MGAKIDITFEFSKKPERFMTRLQKKLEETRRTKEMLRIGEVVAGVIAREVKEFTSMSRWRKTGNLMRSFKPVASKDRVVVGSALPYAAKLQVGGRVLPKGKNLAIPLTEKTAGLWPRDLNLKFSWPIYVKTGSKILVDASTGEPLFVLKPFVDLNGPYVGYLNRAASKSRAKIAIHLVDTLVKSVQKAKP